MQHCTAKFWRFEHQRNRIWPELYVVWHRGWALAIMHARRRMR